MFDLFNDSSDIKNLHSFTVDLDLDFFNFFADLFAGTSSLRRSAELSVVLTDECPLFWLRTAPCISNEFTHFFAVRFCFFSEASSPPAAANRET